MTSITAIDTVVPAQVSEFIPSCQPAVPALRRGAYGEIVGTVGGRTPAQIIAEFRAALPTEFVDFDKAGRGDALNLDIYGWDAEQHVALAQIRHAFRRYRKGYLNVHKDYVLVGHNEGTGQPFRHPVSANAVRAAIRKEPNDPAAAVRGGQRWMWGVTERQLRESLAAGLRQGDVLLVRERAPGGVLEAMPTEVTIADSHIVRAARIVQSATGRVYADGPSLWHAKNQHAPVFADRDGWYSVRAADEADTWRWGERLGD